jgi:hypothetical protein
LQSTISTLSASFGEEAQVIVGIVTSVVSAIISGVNAINE